MEKLLHFSSLLSKQQLQQTYIIFTESKWNLICSISYCHKEQITDDQNCKHNKIFNLSSHRLSAKLSLNDKLKLLLYKMQTKFNLLMTFKN